MWIELFAVSPALGDSIEVLDGQRLIMYPLPHVAVLRDELTQLFEEDYEYEEEEMEARGEHTLSEKFGGQQSYVTNHFIDAFSSISTFGAKLHVQHSGDSICAETALLCTVWGKQFLFTQHRLGS